MSGMGGPSDCSGSRMRRWTGHLTQARAHAPNRSAGSCPPANLTRPGQADNSKHTSRMRRGRSRARQGGALHHGGRPASADRPPAEQASLWSRAVCLEPGTPRPQGSERWGTARSRGYFLAAATSRVRPLSPHLHDPMSQWQHEALGNMCNQKGMASNQNRNLWLNGVDNSAQICGRLGRHNDGAHHGFPHETGRSFLSSMPVCGRWRSKPSRLPQPCAQNIERSSAQSDRSLGGQ